MKYGGFEYSIGNTKIAKDTLIFNMGSATNCPSKARGKCRHEHDCYARKAECGHFQGVREYRARQAEYWLNTHIDQKCFDIRGALKGNDTLKYVRFNEAGDFYQQSCVDQLIAIAVHNSEYTFYGYTSADDFDFSVLPVNLVIQGTEFMVDNAFWAYPCSIKTLSGAIDWGKQKGLTKIVFCPGNCGGCGICKEKKQRNILIRTH